MNRYTFRPGTRLSPTLEPDAVGNELARLSQQTGGLTPTQVVEAARSRKSPIHSAFTWDDEVAGRIVREGEARYLIRCVMVVPKEEDRQPTHAYVNVPPQTNAEGREGVYVTPKRLVAEPDMFLRALGAALEQVSAARSSVTELQTLAAKSEILRIESASLHMARASEELEAIPTS